MLTHSFLRIILKERLLKMFAYWNINTFFCVFSGELISNSLAETRSSLYEKEGKGCFIYYGIKDSFGKSIWYN